MFIVKEPGIGFTGNQIFEQIHRTSNTAPGFIIRVPDGLLFGKNHLVVGDYLNIPGKLFEDDLTSVSFIFVSDVDKDRFRIFHKNLLFVCE
jgi:hypothetical protein